MPVETQTADYTASPTRECLAFRVPMDHPADVSQIEALMDRGHLAAAEIVAILGKTEGNGCVNDFTRGYSVDTIKYRLAPRLGCEPGEVEDRIALVMSGGTEGGLSPHFLVLGVRVNDTAPSGEGKQLAIGTGQTEAFSPESVGRQPQIEATRNAVITAMRQADIDDADDVHLVQIKCPLLTKARMSEAHRQGQEVVCGDTYQSMAYSRGASAMGVALALGEAADAGSAAAAVNADWRHYATRASTSAGVELMRNELLVLGNSQSWRGNLRIEHGIMRDAFDVPAITDVLERLGLDVPNQLTADARERVIAALVKAEASRTGTIRGQRHVMSDDSDIPATRHARALVGGVLGGVIGHGAAFVSGGAEHQGPDGGGPIAIIARH